MVKVFEVNETFSLSQNKCSGRTVTGFVRGFSMLMTLVIASRTGEESSNCPKVSGGEAVIF